MASTSSFSLSSSSPSFIASRVPPAGPHAQPSTVSFRHLRVSASCISATAERPTSASHIASTASLYDILGIDMGATCQEIKAAYRRHARILHPDVAANSQREINAATDQFIKIRDAYETLSDPEKRADYDRTLFGRWRPLGSPLVMSATATAVASSAASGFSGYTRRRWETDQCW